MKCHSKMLPCQAIVIPMAWSPLSGLYCALGINMQWSTCHWHGSWKISNLVLCQRSSSRKEGSLCGPGYEQQTEKGCGCGGLVFALFSWKRLCNPLLYCGWRDACYIAKNVGRCNIWYILFRNLWNTLRPPRPSMKRIFSEALKNELINPITHCYYDHKT